LRVADDDAVSLSNLQRQVLFRTADVGAPKTDRARDALSALNPHVQIEPRPERLTRSNVRSFVEGADLVLDGCDNFETRFVVNEICHELGVALVSGAVGRWDGQVATFKSGITKHLPPEERLPCYRCLVTETPPHVERCAEVGIVGALPGVIGAMMALEATKEIVGAGDSLAGRIFVFDGLAGSARTIALKRDPACPVCGD
jgi:molybdopterin/thiamine biosynthesis adenylyltransferase